MKVCTKCGIEKDESEFSKFKVRNKKSGKIFNGLYGHCKICQRKDSAKRRRKKGIRPRIFRSINCCPDKIPCSYCKIKKPKEEFRIRIDKRDGLQYYNSTCLKCDSAIQHEYYMAKKDDAEFKKKNKERQRVYAMQNIENIKLRKDTVEFRKKHAELNMRSYVRMKDVISAKMKVKRQTPEYKAMIKKYRETNKDKIFKQEKVTKRRYLDKNKIPITDKYVIRLLAGEGTINPTPQQVDLRRSQILIHRIKKHLRNKKFGITKICTVCGIEKDLVDFYPLKKKTKISVVSHCKECSNKKCKEYREKKKNAV